MIIANIIKCFIIANAVVISFFVAYHLLFLMCYVFFRLTRRGASQPSSTPKYNKFAIIVPAHNEELMIGDLVESVKDLDYPKNRYTLIIIADNCTDKTEEIVRKKGIQCFARTDSNKRGKPYALNWILKRIDVDRYDAFSIIDADTIVHKDYLKGMNKKINDGAEAIQAYFDVMNPDDSWLTRLMVIPGILKFKVRYFCKDILGLSCPLMGNGMCFSKNIIAKYGWNAFSVTENWEYYVQLLNNNYIVRYAEDAIIYSHAVSALSQGEAQRKRWFKGRFGVLFDYYKELLSNSLKFKSIRLLDGLIEVLLPSYSILFSWSIILLTITGFVSLLWINLSNILLWIIVLGLIQAAYFVNGLIMAKAPLKTWIALFYVPIFLVWKTFVTFKGLFGLRNKVWEKTERKL